MIEFLSFDSLEGEWFLPALVLMWFGIGGMLSLLSGWYALSSHYGSDDDQHGETFRFVSGSMGLRIFPVNYGNCLFVAINEAGIRLSILFLFRFLCPPLFIPWERTECVQQKRFIFWRYTLIQTRDTWPTITLYGRAGRRIIEVYKEVSRTQDFNRWPATTHRKN